MTNAELQVMAEFDVTEADLKPKNNAEKLNALMDIISIDKRQSDKLGFDWEIITVGNLEVQKKYVAQLHPVGVADNPIVYYDGVELINNAYYLKDGVRFVYMNGEFIEF